MNNKLLTTEQVANLAGMTRNSIYYYIQKGSLSPVYKDKWQQDGTLLFDEEAVEEFLETHKRKGMSTGEVAKLLGVTNPQVLSFIEKGWLKSERVSYGKMERNFIPEQALEDFKAAHADKIRKEKRMITKDKRYAIYQLLVEPLSSQYGRIVSIQDDGLDGMVQFANGSMLTLGECKQRGYEPAYEMSKTHYSKKPGTVTLQTEIPSNIGHTFYKIIDMLYQSLGTKNVKVDWSDDSIRLYVKPMLMELSDKERELKSSVCESITDYIIEGTCLERHNGWLFYNHLESLNCFVKSDTKQALLEKASEQNITLTELLQTIIENYVTLES